MKIRDFPFAEVGAIIGLITILAGLVGYIQFIANTCGLTEVIFTITSSVGLMAIMVFATLETFF